MQFQTNSCDKFIIQPSKGQYNINLFLALIKVLGFNLNWLNRRSAPLKQPWHQH